MTATEMQTHGSANTVHLQHLIDLIINFSWLFSWCDSGSMRGRRCDFGSKNNLDSWQFALRSISIDLKNLQYISLSSDLRTKIYLYLRQNRTQSHDFVFGCLVLTACVVNNLSKEMLDSLPGVHDRYVLCCLYASNLESQEEFGILDSETAASRTKCYLCDMRQYRKRRAQRWTCQLPDRC